ncbi:hypothetical protein C7M84_018405 [Penaeus vannamei]|uniref:Uncharacterized protein n=1 Tax=Penaeus vannamei TaxID=6689 RepID=A0A423UBI7_PENVA|nr:uncharacterized protein LOC113823057 [Penaeus vannamei]ROT86033.1 hypothetical protein C7M84_018405 [Penaeus vannamei]
MPRWFSSLSSCPSSSKSIRSKRAKPRLVRGSTNSATNPKRHRIGYETLRLKSQRQRGEGSPPKQARPLAREEPRRCRPLPPTRQPKGPKPVWEVSYSVFLVTLQPDLKADRVDHEAAS